MISVVARKKASPDVSAVIAVIDLELNVIFTINPDLNAAPSFAITLNVANLVSVSSSVCYEPVSVGAYEEGMM